jgi:hypothetical protein
VSDFFLASSGTSWIINGPTTSAGGDGHDLKPFNWTEFPNTSHLSLPTAYDFDFIQVKPTLP